MINERDNNIFTFSNYYVGYILLFHNKDIKYGVTDHTI